MRVLDLFLKMMHREIVSMALYFSNLHVSAVLSPLCVATACSLVMFGTEPIASFDHGNYKRQRWDLAFLQSSSSSSFSSGHAINLPVWLEFKFDNKGGVLYITLQLF